MTLGILLVVGSLASPASPPSPRVIQGQVVDAQGQPVRKGKVFFGPKDPRVSFAEGSTADLDADGRYRVALADFTLGDQTIPASGPLRFLALSAGFRAKTGKVEAGEGAATVDIRLTPEPWKATRFRFVDRRGKAVAGVETDLSLGGPLVWETIKSDAEGRIHVSTPPGVVFLLKVRPRDHLPTSLGFRGIVGDPTDVQIPLFDPIRGRVIDAAGKPLPGIKIGRLIAPDYRLNVPEPQRPLLVYEMKGSNAPATTDKEGRFDLRPSLYLDTRGLDPSGGFRIWPEPLCFADDSLRSVAFLGVDLNDARAEYEVTLRPGRPVRIPLVHEVAAGSGKIEASWELARVIGKPRPGDAIRVMSSPVRPRAADGEWVEANLPEGSYQITVTSYDAATEKRLEETQAELVVPPGDGPLVLPAIRLEALLRNRLVGRPAPEIDARDLLTGRSVKLADFRGKVVVLDFWGYWCGPCVTSMPDLIQAHDRLKDLPVVILAVHDQSVQTKAAYDAKLAGIKHTVWEDRDLPFRVALDAPDLELVEGRSPIGQGVTCKRYGIEGFPTTLLIDREGKVVGTVNTHEHGRLEAQIKELLDNAPAR